MYNAPLQIKVCGITTNEQATALAQLNVDYIGFIFYEKSARNVATKITFNSNKKNLVGVFVNASTDKLSNALQLVPNITHLQLHGNESPELCQKLKAAYNIIKVFLLDESVSNIDLLVAPYLNVVDMFLFDTKTPQHGGSGKKFDWTILSTYTSSIPFLLSGGIGIDDVEIIKSLQHKSLTGVDVNSKFEINPGVKNINLVNQFITSIKNENNSTT
jgi:phosphoribosylanthranilate isomerase